MKAVSHSEAFRELVSSGSKSVFVETASNGSRCIVVFSTELSEACVAFSRTGKHFFTCENEDAHTVFALVRKHAKDNRLGAINLIGVSADTHYPAMQYKFKFSNEL